MRIVKKKISDFNFFKFIFFYELLLFVIIIIYNIIKIFVFFKFKNCFLINKNENDT